MATVCKTVYKDQHGNRAGSYYDNLHLGHEAALSLYLASMSGHAYAKFQKHQGKVEDFLKISRTVLKPTTQTLDEATRKPFTSPNGKALTGVTRSLNKEKQPFSEQETATRLVLRNRAKELLFKEPTAYDKKLTKVRLRDNRYKLEDYPEALEQAAAWVFGDAYDPALSEDELLKLPITVDAQKRVNKVLDLWNGTTQLGTQIHAVIEEFINHYTKQELDENGDRDRDLSIAHALNSPNLPGKLTNKQKLEYQRLLPQIEAFMLEIGNKGQLRFETEVAIFDEELGVGGFVDLMAFDENTGDVYIFDFKTKEKGKDWVFDYKGKKRTGATKDLWDNKETDGALQTSLYRLIMERQGFNVKRAAILYIEGDLVETELGDYYYDNLSYSKSVRLRYHRDALAKMFAAQGIHIDKAKKRDGEAGKLTTANQILDAVADQNLWERSEESIQRSAANKLNSLNTDEKTGAKYFFNQSTGKREYFKLGATEEDMLKRITEYLKDNQASVAELSNNVISYFKNGMKEWKGGGRYPEVAQQQADLLLAGLDPEHHVLEQLNNFEGFSSDEVSSDILIAIDQRDNSAILINLGRTEPSKISIRHQVDEAKKNRNEKSINMFSRKFSDDTLKRKYGIEGLTSTDQDFKLLRASLLALELMDKKIVSRVDLVRNGSITGKQTYNGDFVPAKNVGMQTMLKHLAVLKDFIGEDASSYYTQLLNNNEITSQARYRNNYIDHLFNLIDAGTTSLKPATIENMKAEIQNWRRSASAGSTNVMKVLLAAQTELGKAKASNESRATSEDYVLVSQAILQLANVTLNAGVFSERLSAENRARTTGRIGNEAISQLDYHVKKAKSFINRDFQDYKRTHKKVFDAIKAEAKSQNISVQEYMKQLYLINPDSRSETIDKANVDILYKLKPENDTSLTDAQRAYIKFFNETIEKGFSLALTKAKYEFVEKGTGWQKGMVPLMGKRSHSQIAEAENLKDKARTIIKLHWNSSKNDSEDFAAINTRIDYPYNEQVGSGIQNGQGRLGKLGLDSEGNRYENFDYDGLENNLDVILTTFYADSVSTAGYEEVLGVYNAMNTIGYIEERFKSAGESNTEKFNVRTYLDEYIKLIVFNEVNKEKSQLGDKLGKTMTMLSMGFSPKQVLLEGMTNLYGSGNSLLQQALMGKDKRYSVSAWTKAGGMVAGQAGNRAMALANAITTEFGVYGSDPESFTAQDSMESAKNNIWQSKWMYVANNLPFKFVKQQCFIAELVQKGITDALSVDETTGKLKYDPSKDARFKDIFHGGQLVKHFDTKEKREQKALWDYLITNLAEENGLDEAGMPLRPITTAETLSMLDYSRSIFGSLDSDQKVLLQASSFGRMFLKFKTWAIAKKDNYWTPTHISQLRGEVKAIKDENGEIIAYDFQPESMEGIVQTLVSLTKGAKDLYKSEGAKGLKAMGKNMTKNQKENMSKLAADIILVSVLTTLFAALFDDDEFKSGPGKLLAQTMLNATGDLNMLGLTGSMVEQGPIAVASFMMNSLKHLWNGVAYTATGDAENGIEHFMKLTGVTKSIYAFVE